MERTWVLEVFRGVSAIGALGFGLMRAPPVAIEANVVRHHPTRPTEARRARRTPESMAPVVPVFSCRDEGGGRPAGERASCLCLCRHVLCVTHSVLPESCAVG